MASIDTPTAVATIWAQTVVAPWPNSLMLAVQKIAPVGSSRKAQVSCEAMATPPRP